MMDIAFNPPSAIASTFAEIMVPAVAPPEPNTNAPSTAIPIAFADMHADAASCDRPAAKSATGKSTPRFASDSATS